MTVTSAKVKGQRREHILQVLAAMLEQSPGNRITTAELAKAVGVSEAALYKHFPSKARMFEGLIEFIEESVILVIRHYRLTIMIGFLGLHKYFFEFGDTGLLGHVAAVGCRLRLGQLYRGPIAAIWHFTVSYVRKCYGLSPNNPGVRICLTEL